MQGPPSARVSVVVYGAYGPPESRRLGKALTELPAPHLGSVRLAWRHLPRSGALSGSAGLALVAEAAGLEGRFRCFKTWLELRHSQPVDVHAAARRVGIDYDRLLALMTACAAADRVVSNVQSALAGGVGTTPKGVHQRPVVPGLARSRRQLGPLGSLGEPVTRAARHRAVVPPFAALAFTHPA